jgi:hypothetical protein
MKLRDIQMKCIENLENSSLSSYDLYDALTNNFLNKITRNKILLRRIIIQINAKSPFNLRWLGMKKMIHTKTLSDLLWYYSLNSNRDKTEFYFRELIKRKKSTGYGWGLNFSYTSRFIDADKEMPNLYNTINSGIAICHAYSLLSDEDKKEATNALKGILDFLENNLGFVDEGDTGWYLYYPGQKHPTYNVNALTLYFISHLRNILQIDDSFIQNRHDKILNLLIKEQNQDGSWFYARSSKGKWIDGFHSAFIIESLAFNYYSGNQTIELKNCIDKAWEFYLKNMFTKDYFPKYFYKDGKFPIESQNCAQSIQTIACMGIWLKKPIDDVLKAVIKNTLVNLYCDKGYFYHKKTKFWTFKTSYSRWSNTPMILGLEYASKYLKSDIG